MEGIGSSSTVNCKQSEKQREKKKESPETVSMDLEKSPEEWYYPPIGGYPIRYLFCGDCTYKTIKRRRLNCHVEKYHSSSITALSSQPSRTSNEATKTGSSMELPIAQTNHLVGGDMKKPTYESVKTNRYMQTKGKPARPLPLLEVKTSSDVEKNREEWYYPPNGGVRCRYQFCLDCNYKTTKILRLEEHYKRFHAVDDTVDSPEPSKKKKDSLVVTQDKEIREMVEANGTENPLSTAGIFPVIEIPKVGEASPNVNEGAVSTNGVLQDRISELSHNIAVCKLRLHFLQVDSINLRLGDPETKIVDQSQLQLIEKNIHSLKEHLNELEVELIPLRGTE